MLCTGKSVYLGKLFNCRMKVYIPSVSLKGTKEIRCFLRATYSLPWEGPRTWEDEDQVLKEP